MKKILLLGGSKQQCIVIEAAKKLGYYTIVCDYLNDNPGQYISDKFYLISTTDLNGILEIAIKEKICGILAYASDPAAYTAAYVSEQLGLPTNPSSSIKILSNKHLFRNFLIQNKLKSPDYQIIQTKIDLDYTKLKYPFFIKPTDSSGSKGVIKVYNKNDIEDAIENSKKYSRNGILIAEECISYNKYGIIKGDIFIKNGKILIYGLFNCIRDNKFPFVPSGKKPLSNKFYKSKEFRLIKKTLTFIIKALNIRFGEFNVEIFISKKREVNIIEIGARAGGNLIPEQLSDIYGLNLVEENIKMAADTLSSSYIKYRFRKKEKIMSYILHSAEYGILNDIKYDPEITSYIYKKLIYCEIGSTVFPFEKSSNAIGIIFLRFPNEKIFKKYSNNINKYISINVKTNIE